MIWYDKVEDLAQKLGELIEYRLCITICALFAMAVCWGTIWRRRRKVAEVYNKPDKD